MDILVLLPFLTVLASASSHDVIAGQSTGASKIYDQTFEASPAIWRQVQNVTVNATNNEVISGVTVTDLREDKDGEAKIVEGGEGQKNVTIELQSPTALRGYEFKVQVFALPDKNAPKDAADKNTQSKNAGKVEENTESTKVGDVKSALGGDLANSQATITAGSSKNLPPARVSTQSDEIRQTRSPSEYSTSDDKAKGISTTQLSEVEPDDGLYGPSIKETQGTQDKVRTDYQQKGTNQSPGNTGLQRDVPSDDVSDDTAPKFNNGQGSNYPNVQPTDNGQLVRITRDTNDGTFASTPGIVAGKNTEFPTSRPLLDQSAKEAQSASKSGASNIQPRTENSSEYDDTSSSQENKGFSSSSTENNGDTTHVHKIPLGKSNGSADNGWNNDRNDPSPDKAIGSAASGEDSAKDTGDFKDKGLFGNLGRLTPRQLSTGVENLENSSKTDAERKVRETDYKSATSEAQIPAEIGYNDNLNSDAKNDTSNSPNDQNEKSSTTASLPIALSLAQRNSFSGSGSTDDKPVVVAPEERQEGIQDSTVTSTTGKPLNSDGEKKPVISIK